jgi:RNA polymerase sigma factor (sigma-70 family)
MPNHPLPSLLRRVQQVLGAQTDGCISDAELLERFLSGQDEAAFELLVRRHERMVWGVCRRMTGDHHDAEDVFQAVFLILARKAGSLVNGTSLAAYLHQVAYRAALRARTTRRRRSSKERLARNQIEQAADDPAFSALEWRELRGVLDQALAELPQAQRAAVVLCYLEGKTYVQAAQELGCPKGTLSIRLTRAREALRRHLARLGVSLPAGVLSAVLAEQGVSAAPPASCVSLAVKAGTSGAAITGEAAALAQGVLRTVMLNKLKGHLVLVLTLALVTGGVLAYQGRASEEFEAERQEAKPASARDDEPGEPLPAGVLARLGSTRLRHSDSVLDVAFLPDGKSLIAADRSSIRVWDSGTGRELRRFGDGNVKSVSLSADRKRLAAAPESSGPYRIWEVATGKLVRAIGGPLWGTIVLSPNGKRLASIGANLRRSGLDSLVHLWDVDTGREVHLYTRHTDIVWTIAFSPDGDQLYSGSADHTIRVWDIASGREVGRFEGHKHAICHLAVSPDGKRLASVAMHYDKYSPDKRSWRTFNRVRIWDTSTRKEVRQIVVDPKMKVDQWGFPPDGFHTIAFTPDSKTLVTTGMGNVIRLWDVGTGKERQQIKMPGTRAYTVAVSPDGRTLAAGDNLLHLWDVKTGRELLPQKGHQSALTAVAVSSDGQTIATSGYDRTIRQWDRKGNEVRRLDSRGSALYLCFASSQQLVSSGGRRTTTLWEVASGRELRRFPGVDSDMGIRWALSPDGKTVAQALRFETVSLWDTATGKQLHELPEEMVIGLGFSPDSRTLLLCDGHKDVHLYNVATGKRLRGFATLPRERHRTYQDVHFSPDGKWVTLWSYRSAQQRTHVRVHLFDTDAGKEVRHFKDLGRPMGFAPDSRLLACRSTDDDHYINLVEVATGKLVLRLASPEAPVRAVAFAADGRTLVTAGADGTALVWDVTGLAGKKVRLSLRECEQKWADLAGPDPAPAYSAGWRLTATPEGVAFLQQHLRPAAAVNLEQVQRWIRDLDDDEFTVRSAATAALKRLGGRAESYLREALKKKPSLEVRRRIEALLKGMDRDRLSPAQLRFLRAVAALEAAGTPEARRLLADLARGADGSLRTREAKSSLARLAARQ